MKDAYSEISVDEFQRLSGKEKILITFMTLKEISESLKKKGECKDCSTTKNQRWIIRIGAGLITWLSLLTFRG
jgi:hypothetical protein